MAINLKVNIKKRATTPLLSNGKVILVQNIYDFM